MRPNSPRTVRPDVAQIVPDRHEPFGVPIRDHEAERTFAGLIYFSPTLNPGEIASAAFREGWQGRPILVSQGGRDHNVPPETVTPVVAMMRR